MTRIVQSAVPRMQPHRPQPSASIYNVANLLTVSRIVLIPVFVWLLIRGDRWSALAVFALASFTDNLDGRLARKYNLITRFGTIADTVADKFLIATAMVTLSCFGELSWWFTAIIVIREFGVTLVRSAVASYGELPASLGGKTKTTFQMIAIIVYLIPASPVGWRLTCMIIASVLTVVTGLDYTYKAWRLSHKS